MFAIDINKDTIINMSVAQSGALSTDMVLPARWSVLVHDYMPLRQLGIIRGIFAFGYFGRVKNVCSRYK